MTRPDIIKAHTGTIDGMHARLHVQTTKYEQAFGSQHTPLTVIRMAHRIYHLQIAGDPIFMGQFQALRNRLKPYIENTNFAQLSDADEARVEDELVAIIHRDSLKNRGYKFFLDTLLEEVVDIPKDLTISTPNANGMAWYAVLRLEEMLQVEKSAREDIDTVYKQQAAMINNGILEGLLHLTPKHFLKHATDYYKAVVALTRLKVGDEHVPLMEEDLYSCFKGAVSAAVGSIEFQRMMPPGTEFHTPFLMHDVNPRYHYDGYMFNFANEQIIGVLQAKSSSSNLGDGKPFVVSRRGQSMDLTDQTRDIALHGQPVGRLYAVANFVAGPNPQGKTALTPLGVSYWEPTFRPDGKWHNNFRVQPGKLAKSFVPAQEVIENTNRHLQSPTDPLLPLDDTGVTVLASCVNYYPLEQQQRKDKQPYIERISNLIHAYYEYAKEQGVTHHRGFFE